ncbi:E3 ubiquitin-protein ligase Topors-like [Grus japonensis]|uniref:E3 ubiquitin-protein ligase Topors n=1 Tax=Grus japonensis TaxID=30415 RepID=A0ABC9XZJ2_GRUJA
MARKLEDRCPICLDSWEEASYVMPCLHQFCYPCIMRWAESKPECPLCKRRVKSILHSVRGDDDFEEYILPPPAAPSVVVRQIGGAHGHPAAHSLHQPAAPQPPSARPLAMAPVGGFYAYVWASIFRVYPAVLQPLLPWLQQELGQLFEDAQEAAAAQSLILSSLRYFGLDEEALIQLLQASLGRHTRSFVHQLVDTTVCRCSGEARRWMGLEDTRTAGGREGSPEVAPGAAASRGGSSTPSPALRGDPSSSPNAPVPTHREQEELQQEPEAAVPGPSTPSQGSQRSLQRPRRAPKRRAGHPEDSSQPHKKPPRHQ